MTTIAQGRVSGLVATRWFDPTGSEGDRTAGQSWFPTDLKPSQEARKRFALDDAFTVVKHTIQIHVPLAVIVEVIVKLISQNTIPVPNHPKTFVINNGVALTEDAVAQFDLILVPGSSYNIQHSTVATIDPAVFITESFNVDI